MTSINFELKTPIKYANNSGDEVECCFIELREPTGKVSHICCAIEGLVQTGVMSMVDTLGGDVIAEAKEAAASKSEKAPADAGEVRSGDGVLALMTGGGVDMNKIVLHFRELFKSVALMGGEKNITAARLDDMSHKDLRKMIGVYAANFILS